MENKEEKDIKTEPKEEVNEEQEKKSNKDEKDLQIMALEKEISSLTSEIEKVKKAAADIVNRNKQMEIERKYASSNLIKRLLVPMSYFEGALKLQSDDEAFNNFLKGFEMIYNLIFDTLISDGLKEIEVKENDKFNPQFHEVSELIEVEEGENDLILEVVQKGYLYKDRVIKPAQVKVSSLKKQIEENEDDNNNDNKEDL